MSRGRKYWNGFNVFHTLKDVCIVLSDRKGGVAIFNSNCEKHQFYSQRKFQGVARQKLKLIPQLFTWAHIGAGDAFKLLYLVYKTTQLLLKPDMKKGKMEFKNWSTELIVGAIIGHDALALDIDCRWRIYDCNYSSVQSTNNSQFTVSDRITSLLVINAFNTSSSARRVLTANRPDTLNKHEMYILFYNRMQIEYSFSIDFVFYCMMRGGAVCFSSQPHRSHIHMQTSCARSCNALVYAMHQTLAIN